jgi:hypothetical protein
MNIIELFELLSSANANKTQEEEQVDTAIFRAF